MRDVRFLVFLLVNLCWLAGAQAQSDKKLGVRFLAQEVPAELGEVTTLLADGETRGKPFALPMNNLSPVIEVPARRFLLTRAADTLPLASVALPEEGRSFIVLLLVNPKGGYQPVVLPADDSAFRFGDYYLHNLSGGPVRGKIGGSNLLLKPGEGRIIKATGAVDGRYYDIAFAVPDESRASGMRFITTSRWPVSERTRSYVFFFTDTRTQRVRFRAVDEFAPVEDAE